MSKCIAETAKMKLAIIGVGLIGGSLGMSLKAALGDDIYITGLCRTQDSMDLAMERGAVDFASSDLETVVKDADIVFLSTPVLQMPPLVARMLPFLKPGVILTDAGSTKGYLYEKLREILPSDVYYIAGHPMTGKEKSGVAAADKDLFKNHAYIIVGDTGAPREAHEKLRALLEHTEATFYELGYEAHDRCASIISHIPHITAAALVTLLNRSGDDFESCLKLAAGGFKDTTRVASGDSDMWADICMTNPIAIRDHLVRMQGILGEVIKYIDQGDRDGVYQYFLAAKRSRDEIIWRTEKLFEL
ncbi:hypothetical protein TAMA11512_12280 [Selenomonas sp. TAMA-11512]|uniref:prephenate dehydrogenase n=1 Tax=Selenomonas sp. TAMA-11512 TaxID=3095337 RepID=UPI00308F2458|nr:hypothetical protein TAMA11512_12280 [Selenomonas sp. TAMA-11512]